MKKLVEEDTSVSATTRELSKEENMGVCHSHNALCGSTFVGNAIYGAEDVFVHETFKSGLKKEKNGLFV